MKIFKILCAICFFVIFWYFFGDEYWEYQEQWQQQAQYEQDISSKIDSFDVDEISEFWGNIELYYTPYLWLLDQIVDEIDSAKERIYIEVYIFTETNMRDAVIRAHDRWVDVRILLENNPYKAPYLNDKHYNAFKDAWIDVRWSDPLNYSLNHSKLMIIDESAYVSTGNFSYSLFKYNRDFLVKFTHDDFIESLEKLFLWDFEHKNSWIYHDNLILSPDYSRDKLEGLVYDAQESIDFYFPYIADDDFTQVMFNIANKWVKVRGIVEEETYNEDKEIIEEFQENNVEIHPLEKDKLHAKAILVDEKYLYIGSINFSSYSFDENREVWVIISDREIIEKFQKIFESDF